MLSGFLAKSYVSASLAGLVLASGEPRFYPSGCGGHKNLENAATFSKFLGREEKPRLRAPLGDVFALPVQLRPPEMEIVVGIGAYCRYWEGGNVALVSVLACMPGSCGGGYCRLSPVSGLAR